MLKLEYTVAYKHILEYTDAIEWLIHHFKDFPKDLDNPVGEALFRNFRFIKTLPEEEIVFGNCLVPGITEEMFYAYRENIYLGGSCDSKDYGLYFYK